MNVHTEAVLGSGLIIEVPEAEPAVGEPRSRLDGNARLGIPAHITVLFPFVPRALIDDATLRRLTGIFAAEPAFVHRLVRSDWFADDVLWLAPEDDTPFRALTKKVHREFPDYPPFGGQFPDVVPHLTIADRRPIDQMRSAEQLVSSHLPISCVATRVSLMVQRDASGIWTRAASFALGTADTPSPGDDITGGMNRKLYRDARLIEEALAQDHRPDLALLIDDAIEGGGSTASEILMRLRTTLTQIRNQQLALPARLEDQIEDLMRAIDGALT